MFRVGSVRPWFVGVLCLLLSACAYPISKQFREEARKDLTFSTVLQNPTTYRGSVVIWGGVIINTLNRPEGTEITVLQTPLDSGGEPADEKFSHGRFIAKSPQFLDPEIYKNGRKITVAGEITGQETRPLGAMQYRYPVLVIKELHLWEKETVTYVYPRYYWGFWNWSYPYTWPYY
jgi:outer membrane lipoprotein